MPLNEEQQQEIEVLESIYPDELTAVGEDEYTILLTLDPPVQPPPPADGEDEEEPPQIIFRFKYPPKYPDVAPIIDISIPHEHASPPYLDFSEDKDALLATLTDAIEENLGFAMIFTLVTMMKDSCESLMASRHNAIEAAREAEKRKLEEKEMEKFRGTKVTRESFLEWRNRFVAEMEEKRRAEEKAREEEELKATRGKSANLTSGEKTRKLTGKQLWTMGLAGTYDEGDEEVDVGKLSLEEKK
ncbi:putative RWD domain protein [Ascobolus immersus RN42]|uniref:Putative RWD domain protein n=1 Tax=Ascobolus immersus RN42 TaxID=1160509 RepID=A0A3N4HQZ6_ASCIM|nr:putative RWD domain protein [Ascobolus immersus RN42]